MKNNLQELNEITLQLLRYIVGSFNHNGKVIELVPDFFQCNDFVDAFHSLINQNLIRVTWSSEMYPRSKINALYVHVVPTELGIGKIFIAQL
jgi:hypothetical protein